MLVVVDRQLNPNIFTNKKIKGNHQLPWVKNQNTIKLDWPNKSNNLLEN